MNHNDYITSRRTLSDDQVRAVIQQARRLRSAALRDLLASAGRGLGAAFASLLPRGASRSPTHDGGRRTAAGMAS